ncbi:glycosyltransferase family 2 protein [Burkholderia sp. ABCPW 14]|uniref:glycosyltransferase family 2 protein n=1 Tax=Burkholderia sp. ABCPW 14 TaxID=1637860 RepID=UPI000AA7190A
MTSGQPSNLQATAPTHSDTLAGAEHEPERSNAIQRIAELEHELVTLRADLVRHLSAESKREQLERELATLRQSVSWRITAPLRQIAAVARIVRIVSETIQRQANVQGNYAGAFMYYGKALRREGLGGFFARLRRLRGGMGFADAPPSDAVYHAWIDKYDTLGDAQRLKAQMLMQAFKRKPVISIVVPTYNSDPSLLDAMIRSVRTQIYPHWELCLADDASTSDAPGRIIRQHQAEDVRIKAVFRETNGHISEASNSALTLATGEYIALLDHDDILPAHALFVVAQYMNRHPDARMFYSDEDKLTEDGKRTMPYFKSDWNPAMFATQNMFSHLGVIETALVKAAGGFRPGFEGSQDYDLAWRCVEIAGHATVVHIPHVLYHWRITPSSTAGTRDAKPYAAQAALRAVDEHLKRTSIAATVEQPFDSLGILRIRYTIPSPAPRVSIVIPTRDGVALVRQCIDSVLQKTLYPNYEIIVVDNGSFENETLAYFAEIGQRPNVRILRDDSPFNFSALNNRAAAVSTGAYLCLLNNDTEVISPDWLDEMVGLASQPGNGAVGAALWYPNDVLQHGGVLLGLGGIAGHMHHMLRRGHLGYFNRAVTMQNLSAVTAACLVIRKSVFDEVGGMNEELAVAFNDVDFCLRVREAGYANVWTPYAELYHHESATRGSDMAPEKYARFAREVDWMEQRWGAALERDPAYNPNLSLGTDVLPFTLADPPRVRMFD